jgi:hypothetical protein
MNIKIRSGLTKVSFGFKTNQVLVEYPGEFESKFFLLNLENFEKKEVGQVFVDGMAQKLNLPILKVEDTAEKRVKGLFDRLLVDKLE